MGNLIYYPIVGTGGTVTSVSFTGDGVLFQAAPGPAVITAGTLTPVLLTQTANTILAGPASGPNATPTFRALVAADIPVGGLGADMEVLYNKAGVIAGDANFEWDYTNQVLTITGSTALATNSLVVVTPGNFAGYFEVDGTSNANATFCLRALVNATGVNTGFASIGMLGQAYPTNSIIGGPGGNQTDTGFVSGVVSMLGDANGGNTVDYYFGVHAWMDFADSASTNGVETVMFNGIVSFESTPLPSPTIPSVTFFKARTFRTDQTVLGNVITNAYGLYVENLGSVAPDLTVTHNYGVYIADQGASQYAIYAAGGQNYFAGSLVIASQPTFRLVDSEASLLFAGSTTITGSVAGVRGNITQGSTNTIAGGFLYGVQGKLTLAGTLNNGAGFNAGLFGQVDTSNAAFVHTSGYLAPIMGDFSATSIMASDANANMIALLNTTNCLIHSALLFTGNASNFLDATDLAFGGAHFIISRASSWATSSLKVVANGTTLYIPLVSTAEFAATGSGSVVLATTPTFVTSIITPVVIFTAATPSVAGGQLGIGTSIATITVATPTPVTGPATTSPGPASPAAIAGYLEMNLGGTPIWVPYCV